MVGFHKKSIFLISSFTLYAQKRCLLFHGLCSKRKNALEKGAVQSTPSYHESWLSFLIMQTYYPEQLAIETMLATYISKNKGLT